MKKLTTVVVIVVLGFVLIPGTILAWDDCPKGLVDDPYPGECARYIDTDDDGICDHSQPAPEDREVSTQSTDVNNDDSINSAVSNNSDKVGQVDVASDPVRQVASASLGRTNDSKQKLFVAVGIVITHLIGIITYVNYRKRKAQL